MVNALQQNHATLHPHDLEASVCPCKDINGLMVITASLFRARYTERNLDVISVNHDKVEVAERRPWGFEEHHTHTLSIFTDMPLYLKYVYRLSC